mmetsp:Transcript_17015/g.57741  ORF Transcript_17015/g.57741 Transcript_17015/m.57741 type:complete len:168 (-) Transcript_17015:30-533(-)
MEPPVEAAAVGMEGEAPPPPEVGAAPASLHAVVHGALGTVIALVRTFGWPILLSVVGLLLLRHHMGPVMERWRRERVLAEANAPSRRDVLDEDMRRKREERLRALEEENRRKAAEEARAPKKKPEPAPSARPSGPPRPSSGYNPLAGGGGISGFQPSGAMRRVGRGG